MTTLTVSRETQAVLQSRQPLLAALQDHLDAALVGRAQVVFVTGEPGVGRSRLVADFCATTRSARVVEVTCHPSDALVGNHLLHGLSRALAGPGRLALVDGATNAAGLLEDVIDALAEATPLVLVLGQLQWADPDSVAAMATALNALAAQPLLVLAICPSADPDPLQDPDPAVPHHEIAVLPLEPADMANVVGQAAPGLSAAAVADVVAGSRGLPLLAQELIHARRGDLALRPDSEPEILAARSGRLTGSAATVAQAVALAGAPIGRGPLGAACDLSPTQVSAAVAEAILAGVLRTDPDRGGYCASHPAIAAAVASAIPPEVTSELHRNLGAALADAGDDARALTHFRAAGDPGAIRDCAQRAGRAASRAHAPRTELAVLEIAISARPARGAAGAPDVGLLAQAAEAALASGERNRAGELLDAAIARLDRGLRPTSPQAELAAALLLDRAHVQDQLGRAAAQDAARALALLSPESPARALACARSASYLLAGGRADEAQAAAQAALAQAEQLGDQHGAGRIRAVAGMVLVNLAAARGEHSPFGRAALMAARDAAVATGDLPGLMDYYQRATDCLIRSGKYPRAVELAEQARAEAARRGFGHTLGTALAGNAAQAMVLAGNWDSALATVAWALPLHPPADVAAELHLQRAIIAFRRGQREQCQADLQRARSLTEQPGPARLTLTAAGVRASLAATAGEHQHALQVLDTALPDPGAPGAPPTVPSAALWPLAWVWARVLAGALAKGAVDPKVGWAQAKRIEGLVRQLSAADCHPAWPMLLTADLTRVYDMLRPARTDRQLACWRAAVQVLGVGPGLRYELAYAQLRLAEQLLDHGERRAARNVLGAGSSLISELDAHALAGTAQRIADSGRLNLRPVNGRRDVLTPREREVLALLAQSWTNADISRELGIAQKTTSVHVSNILAKLGVASRVEAGAWAHENPDEWCPVQSS